MDLNRILKKCRIRHIFIVLGCKRYYNWKRGICMDQEYQALVVLDLLTTQMNKYANKKLKPYGLKFNELNIIFAKLSKKGKKNVSSLKREY